MEPNRSNLSELELRHGRDINLLLDTQRPTVANALAQLSKTLSAGNTPATDVLYFFENHILKNYLTTFDSHFDSIREASLVFLRTLATLLQKASLSMTPETQKAILERVLGRVGAVPFPEQSEEIRLSVAKVLTDLMPCFQDAFFLLSGQVVQAVSCLLQDKFPESKKQACQLLERLVQTYPEQVATGSKKLIVALTHNAFHAHSKIRRVSVDTLAQVLSLPRIGENVKVAIEAVGPLAADKSVEVREAVYKCFVACLLSLGLEALRENEVFLMCELMGGLEDESVAVTGTCRVGLEQFAERRKVLHAQFGS